MKSLKYLCLLLITLTSCDIDSKKIMHDDNPIKTELKKDSTKIEIADFPILIDSTEYLIHAIGHITEYSGSRSSMFSSYSDRSNGYTSSSVAHYNNFTISGELNNIKFQHIDSKKLTPITDKVIKITSITYLKDIAKQKGLNFLIYNIYDQDTNKDMTLDYEDVKAFYISNIDGTNFKKLTADLEQLVDWKIIPELNRLYFKSIADINKNGEFDKTDKVSYRYVDLSNLELKITEYNPV